MRKLYDNLILNLTLLGEGAAAESAKKLSNSHVSS
jgi:hypothetical protein